MDLFAARLVKWWRRRRRRLQNPRVMTLVEPQQDEPSDRTTTRRPALRVRRSEAATVNVRRASEQPQASDSQAPTEARLRRKYEVEEAVLGKGHFGTVRACRLKSDPNQMFAVKTIVKATVERPELIRSEVSIMIKLRHPNIVRVHEILNEKGSLHIITELCTGGELLRRILDKAQTPEKRFSERSAAIVLRQILEAVHYCHSRKPPIAHRDLKPENVLFKDETETTLKVIDFGLSKLVGDVRMDSFVGTPGYMAPEVISRGYTLKADVWSIGVIAYILFCGFPPFTGTSEYRLLQMIRDGTVRFPSPDWDTVSEEAKDFVRHLLHKNESKRYSTRSALAHVFFKKAWSPTEEDKMAAVAARMSRFVRAPRFKRLALNVLSQALLMEGEVSADDKKKKKARANFSHLRQIFDAIDKDADGKICAAELEVAIAKSMPAASIQDLVEGIDASGDGFVSFSEFLAATMERNFYMREEHVTKAFLSFDRERKGYITLHNLVSVVGGTEEDAADLIQETDAHADSKKLTYAEFKSLLSYRVS
ncbi:hypothetical protein CTAYLR_002983 [Chrysophaeum taylorii]|uniref:Calcium-dependent protein kinase n=1 Tax=Chrysophaeum taylorii TaxID=2483200 RepID=A0AAD7XJF4_9STRA|nr:hypothetical protein CTAYLR_002983 [Chrysophaeum taylorii]